jgi:hypothetical protein
VGCLTSFSRVCRRLLRRSINTPLPESVVGSERGTVSYCTPFLSISSSTSDLIPVDDDAGSRIAGSQNYGLPTPYSTQRARSVLGTSMTEDVLRRCFVDQDKERLSAILRPQPRPGDPREPAVPGAFAVPTSPRIAGRRPNSRLQQGISGTSGSCSEWLYA